MAASLFQVCRMFRVMMSLVFVVTGAKATRNGTLQLSGAKATRNGTLQQSDTSFSEIKFLRHPRFIAARWGSRVIFNCKGPSPLTWIKTTEEGKPLVMEENFRVSITSNESMQMMEIKSLQPADSGTYFCQSSNSTGKIIQQRCGTGLRIMGISTIEQVQNRNTLKDVIILIQTILLVLFVSIPVFLTLGKGDGKDLTGEDHTYEGLAVELADTYEDIGTYQDKADKEKWNLGEHPCEE